jgi:hypothetical protein
MRSELEILCTESNIKGPFQSANRHELGQLLESSGFVRDGRCYKKAANANMEYLFLDGISPIGDCGTYFVHVPKRSVDRFERLVHDAALDPKQATPTTNGDGVVQAVPILTTVGGLVPGIIYALCLATGVMRVVAPVAGTIAGACIGYCLPSRKYDSRHTALQEIDKYLKNAEHSKKPYCFEIVQQALAGGAVHAD